MQIKKVRPTGKIILKTLCRVIVPEEINDHYTIEDDTFCRVLFSISEEEKPIRISKRLSQRQILCIQ